MAIFYLVGALLLCLLLILTKALNKLWWTPYRIQKLMASQGIKGPSYKFLHGNTKEIITMRNEAMATPIELSHVHDLAPRLIPHTYLWMKLYGKIFLNWMGPQPELVVTDPELVKVVFNNRDGAFEVTELQGHAKKVLADGLVDSKGEKWQKQRKLANHFFNVERLKGMNPDIIASMETMLERWRNHVGKEIDVTHEFKLFTSEVISRTAFGSSYEEGEHIFNILIKLTTLVLRYSVKIRIPGIEKLVKTSDGAEAERLERAMTELMIKLIRKREERMASGEAESYGSDLLGILLSAYHSVDESKKIALNDVVGECKTFYLGAQDTSTNLLCWTLLLLSINQDWQDKARAEVLQLFGNENPNPQGIARLKTMGLIINETLRLYSLGDQLKRTTIKDVKLGELIVPAGMQISTPTIFLHHNPKIWGEDAQLFNPQRFAEGVAKATNNQTGAFIPFGMGPRNCVGLNFATNEAKIALSMILQRYRFTLSPKYVHSPVQTITLTPQYGMQIILHAL